MGKVHTCRQCPHRSILVSVRHLMESVKDVKTPKLKRVANVLNRRIWAELVIQAPIAVRKSGTTLHHEQGRLVFRYQVFVLQIIIRSRSVENRPQFLGIFRSCRPILHLRERGPVAEGSVVAELDPLLGKGPTAYDQQHSYEEVG